MRNGEAGKEGAAIIVQMRGDKGLDKSFVGGFVKQSRDLNTSVDVPRGRFAYVFMCF